MCTGAHLATSTSNDKPHQITGRHPALETMHDIAQREATRTGAWRSFTEMPSTGKPREPYHLFNKDLYLRPVVESVLNVNALPYGTDILSVLFEQAAIDVLIRMPNDYWLWQVIQGAIPYGAQPPITADNVKKSVEHQVSLMLDHMREQPSPWPADRRVTSAQACWRVAVGVDLMSHNTGAIVRNPMFDLKTRT